MRTHGKWRGLLSLWTVFCLLASLSSTKGALLDRPMPENGSQTKTLLLHAARRTPYALFDGVKLLSLLLGRIDTQILSKPLADVTAEELADADYLVVFCPLPAPEIPSQIISFLNSTNGRVLWVGHGLSQLKDLPPFFGQFETTPAEGEVTCTNLCYRDQTWSVGSWASVPIDMPSNSLAQIHMFVPPEPTSPLPRPVSWTLAGTTFLAGVPNTFAVQALFGDLLLDFYGISQPSSPHILVILEGIHPASQFAAFQRKVDYLYDRGIPFVVAATPAYEDPKVGQLAALRTNPEFVTSLLYAQNRGGRLVLNGLVQSPEISAEFWDMTMDRPIPSFDVQEFRGSLETNIQELINEGLFPLAWMTPRGVAPSHLEKETAQHFSMALGVLQLSDATHLESYMGTALLQDHYGRMFLPKNMGYLSLNADNEWALLQAHADILLSLRSTLATCEIPNYLPFDKFASLVSWLETLGAPFLDIAKLDLWLEWPGGLLLTHNASRTLMVPEGSIRWKALDLSGAIINEFTEPNLTDSERILRNRGSGIMEIYEFIERKP